jgi:hypothetical protein
MKEMDPNAWTVKDVEDITIRLGKAQGEETTIKSAVVPSEMSSGSGFVKNTTTLTCYNCGRIDHIKKRCPYKTISKPTKKAVM